MMDFSKLEALGVGKIEFAKVCGVSRISVYNWMRGKTKVDSRHAARIAKLLKLVDKAAEFGYLPRDDKKNNDLASVLKRTIERLKVNE